RGQWWSAVSARGAPAVPRAFSFLQGKRSRARSYTAGHGHRDGAMITFLRAPTIWLTERPAIRRLITEHRLGRRFAGRFVAGDTLEAAMRAVATLRDQGIPAMLDHLGENVRSPAQAAEATDAYVRALKRIHESPGLDCNISVTLTQLGLDTGEELCADNMERVLEAANGPASSATLVMIDMEGRQYVDRTLDLYLSLRTRYPN